MTPGHPALAFLNSVQDDGKTRKADSFADGAGFVAILESAGLVPRGLPAPSRGQMTAIKGLREAGHAVLSAIAANRRPGREEALTLEAAIKSALQDAGFALGPKGLTLQPGPLGGLHDHLALALFDLLGRDDLDRLRECRRCTHLFLDHGRGQGRRWCSMARCGNRAKVETFRARQRAEG
ncbi:CGNR zinc finger domain-containing protein [Roseicyclus marinus]|uniref:CGNR zinc finger domain-containing protein n=1 Tax=Roseicyclus marinus TaxID=2161673 RepID=UPI0024108D6C|nr:CGNR zinc finger domain-containing protein [Roseicyclus marinus]MDG3041212.1 CGNR zinc finger domain-containing protein [Roseicyclus marinus]